MSEADQNFDRSRHDVAVDAGASARSQPAYSAATGVAAPAIGSAAASDSQAAMTFDEWRWPLLGAVTMVGILLWVFNDFFSRQLQWAVDYQADWGHTLVIPLIAGYFVYLNRKKLLARPFRTTWIGLLPIVFGVAWYIFCNIGPQTIRHHNLHGLGVGITLFGVILLFCGFRAMTILLFPLVYLFVFGQTISDRFMDTITFRLQDIAARGSHVVLILLGMDVERSGNVLTVFHNGEERPLNIAEACSGMRMLMAFLALGVAMAYTMLKHRWQQIVLVLMAFPTAIFVNMLRVVTLALLSLVDADLAAGDFHTFIGLIWLVPAFLIYLGCMWIVTNIVIEEDTDADADASPDESATSNGRAHNERGDS